MKPEAPNWRNPHAPISGFVRLNRFKAKQETGEPITDRRRQNIKALRQQLAGGRFGRGMGGANRGQTGSPWGVPNMKPPSFPRGKPIR